MKSVDSVDIELSVSFELEQLLSFNDITCDPNRMHVDPECAQSFGYPSAVVNGALASSTAVGLTYKSFGLPNGSLLLGVESSFHLPLFAGVCYMLRVTLLRSFLGGTILEFKCSYLEETSPSTVLQVHKLTTKLSAPYNET